MKYVALLRGINVGGVTVKMADLKKICDVLGFKDAKTLLASGNVVFDTSKTDARKLQKKLEEALQEKFKRDIRVIVRPMHDIAMFHKAKPFGRIKTTSKTKLYATFLDKPPKKHLRFDTKHFTVVKTCPFVVAWVTWDPSVQGTVDFMEELHKYYGKDITTRNWNTVQKILAS